MAQTMSGIASSEKELGNIPCPPAGKMSAMRRGSSSTRRTARVAAAPYPVLTFQQDSTSSDSPAKPRSIASPASSGSWALAPASGDISAEVPGPQLPQQGGSSSSGVQPHLHLHRTEQQANQFIDESQTQHNYMMYQHQQQLNVVTADPQIVNEAWEAIDAARQDAFATRVEAVQYVEQVEAGVHSHVQSVESHAENSIMNSEMRLSHVEHIAQQRERNIESEAERRHATSVLQQVNQARATDARRIQQLEDELARARSLLASVPPPTVASPAPQPGTRAAINS